MRCSLAHRLTILLVALLTLGAYGERVFGRYTACGCSCPPAVLAVTSAGVAARDGLGLGADAGTDSTWVACPLEVANGDGDADGVNGGGHNGDGNGDGCACPCHAATFATPHPGAPALVPLRPRTATLHPALTQRPAEGVRAGIEYPPRAA